MLYQVHLTWMEFKLMLVVIGTDCIGGWKSNYHTITITTTTAWGKNYGVYSQICIKRSPLEQRKSESIHMKISMTGQEKGDILIHLIT